MRNFRAEIEAGRATDGLSEFTLGRIAQIRAERRAFDKARAAQAEAGRPRKYPSLEIAPFERGHDALAEAIALRVAAETCALVGILFFILVTLAAVAVFGDAPGMSTALAAAGI
jgi:hypothetical protein